MLIRNIVIFIVALVIAMIVIKKTFENSSVKETLFVIGLSAVLTSIAMFIGWFVC